MNPKKKVESLLVYHKGGSHALMRREFLEIASGIVSCNNVSYPGGGKGTRKRNDVNPLFFSSAASNLIFSAIYSTPRDKSEFTRVRVTRF